MQQWLQCLLLVVCVSQSWPSDAKSPNASVKPMVIRIAAEDNWPPFSDEKGKGLSAQLVSAAFARSGYKIETVHTL